MRLEAVGALWDNPVAAEGDDEEPWDNPVAPAGREEGFGLRGIASRVLFLGSNPPVPNRKVVVTSQGAMRSGARTRTAASYLIQVLNASRLNTVTQTG